MKIKVAGSDIKIVKEEPVVVGSKNVFEIQFQFDKNWNKMTNKTAVLYQPSVNRDDPICQIIDKDNKVYVPTAGMVVGDYLYIGVFGFNEEGTLRLPTVYTYTYVFQGCYEPAKVPGPDNSVYEQIYNMALKAFRTAQIAMTDAKDVRRQAEEGEFNGDPGFSPRIIVKEDTSMSYILTIITEEGEFDTPNLVSSGSGDLTYTYEQVTASSEWKISHNLKKKPSVTVVDSAGTMVVGDVLYDDLNNLTIRFSSEFSGSAFLN